MKAQALWCVGSNSAEIRPASLGEGVLVRTLFSGISRGTERLVLQGRVPNALYQQMRAAGQEGEFSFPVKYGYCTVGEIFEGELKGRLVFALHPHQDFFRLPAESLHLLPIGLPPERAILAANMETALNILWDSNLKAGDRVAVIGAGVIGALTGYLAAQLPGTEVTLIDVNPSREALAKQLGCEFATPEAAPGDCDVVIHTSASSDGLTLAISLAGQEATIVEASWYGVDQVTIPLGGEFHTKRLRIQGSQVGNLSLAQTKRWSHKRRMNKALELLADQRLDALVSGETPFMELPSRYLEILSDPQTLCHRVSYQ